MKKIIFSLSVILLFCASSCRQQIPENTDPAITETFSDTWKFRAGEGVDSLWMNTDYSDTNWQEVSSLKLLKDQDVKLDNGFGWYRKKVQLSDSLMQAVQAKGAVMLHLGRLAATDEVYFNGKLVGKTGEFPHDYRGYHDEERNYLVSLDDINLTGDNLIAIKFHDGWNIGGFLEGAKLTISTAETNDKIALDIAVADSDYIFMAPNPVDITVNINNKNKWAIDGTLLVTLTTDDYQPLKADSLNIKIAGQDIYSKSFGLENPNPGFYRYTVQFNRNNELAKEKKFNVGFEPEKINSPIDAKEDFKTFWDNNLKDLAKVAPNYKLTLVPEYSEIDYDIYLVEMRSFGNELIRGYYAKPKREGKHPVIVEYMGYGSQPYPPNRWWDGFAYFVLSIRGQALNQPTNRFGTWITYGLENKDDYYYRGAFLDVVRALDFVSSRPEIDAERIGVRGGSQGGALSFVAAALDKRVKVAAPNIPFLSDYPDYFKIVHWPKSDFDNYMAAHPDAKWDDVYNLLTYFDIKNLAQWIECPLIMGIGVQDEVCPPHINFAAYNQVKSEKRWMAFPDFGHSVGKVYNDAAMAFFKEKLNVK
jgi:cephalosporin-C deacetylase-like acetyl esterase